MIQYQEKRIKNEDDKNEANTIMSRVLDDNAPLTKTNGMLLMAPFVYGNTTDITVKAGYTPQYSITQTHIHLMFKYLYKNICVITLYSLGLFPIPFREHILFKSSIKLSVLAIISLSLLIIIHSPFK